LKRPLVRVRRRKLSRLRGNPKDKRKKKSFALASRKNLTENLRRAGGLPREPEAY
jgi:hypothetical protein